MLGDRIAIMSHGQIKCLGTPLNLKNRFGDGYRLNVTARPDAIDQAKEVVQELLPGKSKLSHLACPLSNTAIHPPKISILRCKIGRWDIWVSYVRSATEPN